MGIFLVHTYTIRDDAKTAHDERALPQLLEHWRTEHPLILSGRAWQLKFGADPARRGRILVEEYESLTAMDELEAKEYTPGCDKAWGRIDALVVPGTFKRAIWTDLARDKWKEPSTKRK
jgi:hypothetical protein